MKSNKWISGFVNLSLGLGDQLQALEGGVTKIVSTKINYYNKYFMNLKNLNSLRDLWDKMLRIKEDKKLLYKDKIK